MILVSFPLVRFIPLVPGAPGVLGLPPFVLDPPRPPFLPDLGGAPPQAKARTDTGLSDVAAAVLLPSVVPAGPELPDTPISPRVTGPARPTCHPVAGLQRDPEEEKRKPSSARRTDRKPRGKGPDGCGIIGPRTGGMMTLGPPGKIAAPPGEHRGWTVPKHGPKHPDNGHHAGHHKPKKEK